MNTMTAEETLTTAAEVAEKMDILKLVAAAGLDYAAQLLGIEEVVKATARDYLVHNIAVVVDNALDIIITRTKQRKVVVNKAAARLIGRFYGDDDLVVINEDGPAMVFFYLADGVVDFSHSSSSVLAYYLEGTGEVDNWGDFIY